MQLIIEKDYEQMSHTALQLLYGVMYTEKQVHLAITAGATPQRMYQLWIEDLKSKQPLKNVIYYNFDEIPTGQPGSRGVTMDNLYQQFFTPAQIPESQIHALTPANFKQHDKHLRSVGGLDAILMGIGADGHFCGNLPGTTSWQDETVEVPVRTNETLKQAFLPAVEGDESKLPESYVTMGPKSIMQIKKPIMFASGKSKASIIKKAFFGAVTPNIPSSIFQLHPNFTLLLDKDAASEI